LDVAASDFGGLPSVIKVFSPNLTEVPVYLHYIADWKRSKENVNNTFMKWRWGEIDTFASH